MFADRLMRNALDIRLLKAERNLDNIIQLPGGFSYWDLQELTGSVAQATNVAVALGRNAATLTYAAYTPGANWANSSAQIARHTASSTATIRQNGIIAKGKTWEYPVVIANRTAGSVSLTGGDVSASANGTTTVTITATGADVIITPTSDFDGDIDLAQGTVKQTNIAASSAFPGAELLDDGDMEAAGTAAWTAGGSATLSKQTGTRTGGSGTKVLRVARNGAVPTALQIVTTIGLRYRVVAWARSDGNAIPRCRTGATIIVSGTNSTDWQKLDAEFIAVSDTFALQSVTNFDTEYTEWDDVSVTEANPLNGDHTGISRTTGNTQIPVMVSYDGATSLTNIYSAELNSIFNPDAGTLIAFARVANAGVWTDGIFHFSVLIGDAALNNFITFSKTNINNELQWQYEAGGTNETIRKSAISTTGIFMMAITWEKPGNMSAYYNGALEGIPQAIGGTWAANFDNTRCVIGALDTTPTNVWDGNIAYLTLYSRALSVSEILRIARAGGIA
ncbi:hypothetical protein LCGC14_0933860 [marine sediment metagenome]|uniref:Uncharacterized protein n=1 Tax=marine sediment metagenome TaxID=412755 RepID=A0A0F9RTM7_9ZZZZ